MHHIYTGGKGDPLCPLGFHPQVRWPTRCKRCFRDYKEHGGKSKENDTSTLRKDDTTMSTPSLSSWNSTSSRGRETSLSSSTDSSSDSRDSSGNESHRPSTTNSRFSTSKSLSSSWTSTPDLGNIEEVSTTVSIKLPRRRVTSDLTESVDSANKTAEFTIRRRTSTTDLNKILSDTSESDSSKSRLDDKERKMSKISSSANATESLKPFKKTKASLLESKKLTPLKETNGKPPGKLKRQEFKGLSESSENPDVEFILKVKSTKPNESKKTGNMARHTLNFGSSSNSSGAEESAEEDDNFSIAGTETTETTLVDRNENELLEQIESLKNELETMKTRCERVEREKSDILLRRLASYDTTSSRTAASELLKLQQKVNELSTQSEDLKDDNKSLSLRVKELEKELEEQKKSDEMVKKAEELQAKLAAAETLCEELMDENEDMKKELRDLEEEIEEMQDNFREDQADEYSSLKKELEQTTKNCRILSFKLKKSERKAEQLELEKIDIENKYKEFAGSKGLDSLEKIKKLENDLKVANEVASRLTKELEEANGRLKSKDDLSKKKAPLLGNISKPGEKVSRSSMTRGGSQEDPQQLLRDLQDSLEREADLREQLRFAEEELSDMILKKQLNKLKKSKTLENIPLESLKEKDDYYLRYSIPKDPDSFFEFCCPRCSRISDNMEKPTQTDWEMFESEVQVDVLVTDDFAQTDIKTSDRDVQYEPQELTENSADKYDLANESGSEPKSIWLPPAVSLRKKAARIEEDNDSLALQLKKMATKAKTGRKSSPARARLTPESYVEKDEGISEEEDPAELRLMLELNEQESAILRKKVEELESDSENHKRKIKELEEKLSAANSVKKPGILGGLGSGASALDKQKMKVMEDEVTDLRKKLIEKEREIERLQGEVQMSHKKKGTLMKSKSLDSPMEQQTLDLKRQLQLVEQEAAILRARITTLETDNEKLVAENKKLELLRGAKKTFATTDNETIDKIASLEAKLAESEKTIKELQDKPDNIVKKTGLSAFGKSTELEKLKKELKTKSDELEKVTKDFNKSEETLRRLREDATSKIVEFYQARVPKKPTDMHTKLQMKKMVEELENEVGDILVALKNAESQKSGEQNLNISNLEEKEKKIRELEEKLTTLEKEKKTEKKLVVDQEDKNKLEKKLNDVKESKKKLEKELVDEKEKAKKFETEKKKLEEEKKMLETELSRLEKDNNKLVQEKKQMVNEISKLELEKKNASIAQDEVSIFARKLEAVNKDLEREKETTSKLKKQLEELSKVEEEVIKLQKEMTVKDKNMKDSEQKLKENDEKLKKLEKSLSINKSKVTRLEKAVDDMEKSKAESDSKVKNLKEELKKTEELNSSMKDKISKLESDLDERNETIKSLEESIRKERERATDASIKADSAEKREIKMLREDMDKKLRELEEITEKCEKLEKEMRHSEEKQKRTELELIKEKGVWESKASELESDLNAERKKIERMKVAHEKDQRNHETELSSLKVKLRTLEHSSGASTKKVNELKDEYTAKIQKLESELAAEKREYEDLTVKYDLLEEEHVVTKAQLVMEKEHIQSQVIAGKRDIECLEEELKTLRDTYNSKQESWIKEKIDLQEKLKETTERITRTNEAKWELEKSRLTAINEEQRSLTEQLKQQNESVIEQMEHMRKENEELRKKLDDFDKVSKIQRQITADTNQMDQELREVRGRLAAEEKNHKSEMAALKLRYESRVNLITEELQTSQSQVSRFKRERDTYRHMLEEAQSQMAELKSGAKNRDSRNVSSSDEMEDSKTVIANLEQQVSCMEDELSEARLECSKLKTELVSEKSAWEVKLSELQSRVNELEEDKILSSGRTKIPGLRTRMELAWQKEREDQQRILQETSTLARDLRQTLFEVERERDKERLEAKRRQEQMKRASEEEMEENRKKITELQCDLLELRDAHAKLRTTNEKLRREKERWDKESRTLQRSRMKNEEDERKIHLMVENVDTLLRLFPQTKDGNYDISRKKVSKSRETSPAIAKPEDDELKKILRQLGSAADDLRTRNLEGEDRDRSRRSASTGFRRAASTEADGIPESASVMRRPTGSRKQHALHRKSLSLSDTTGPGQDQAIWKDDEHDGSLTSLEEHVHKRLNNIGRREASMDSGMSADSTQSDIVERKKKKGLLGKLKKLTKSRSIEDRNGSQEDLFMRSTAGSDSDMSFTHESERGSKKDLREKLTGMFKRGGSSSRSNSIERNTKSDDSKAKSLPRNVGSSQMNSSSSQSSSVGRPLGMTRNSTASTLRRP